MKSIPVLTYHSVHPRGPLTPTIFEAHLQYLCKQGIQTVHCPSLADHISGKAVITEPSVQLTFDDGWLDNWLYVYPLLQKYHCKATIFVITRNIEAMPAEKRTAKKITGLPTQTEVFESTLNDSFHPLGFMSWEELREMQQSGLVEVQSHSHRHAYAYTTSNIVDFNRLRHWKIQWATDGDFRVGIPEYEGGSALIAPRFFDPIEVRDACYEEAIRSNAVKLLKQPSGKKRFNTYFHRFVKQFERDVSEKGTFETEEAFRVKALQDLQQSRALIQARLGSRADFLCWPWGDYSQKSISLAKEAGFRGAYSLDRGANIPGVCPYALRRFEVRAAPPHWLAQRIFLYSHPLLARLYGKIYHRF